MAGLAATAEELVQMGLPVVPERLALAIVSEVLEEGAVVLLVVL
jgi:hypothetical protein